MMERCTACPCFRFNLLSFGSTTVVVVVGPIQASRMILALGGCRRRAFDADVLIFGPHPGSPFASRMINGILWSGMPKDKRQTSSSRFSVEKEFKGT